MYSEEANAVVRFVLDGQRHEISRFDAETRLAGVCPSSISTHAVKINECWYPVRQAFGIATGIPTDSFNSHTARRHLQALGFEIRGEIAHRDVHTSQRNRGPSRSLSEAPADGSWHTEANVQAALISAIEAEGWRVLSQADTATKARGIDVVASRGEVTVGIEVKGFPARTYADPRRAGETKPTQPSTQAGHWFSQAVLAAMRLRTRHPTYISVVALPDFQRYRTLYADTKSSLDASGIQVWWIHETGAVERPWPTLTMPPATGMAPIAGSQNGPAAGSVSRHEGED